MDDFYLFANCNFVPDKYNDWQAAYDSLASYVFSSEPTTKSYYFGIPIDYAHDFAKTTSMFAFEVYGTREDLYSTHLASPAMQSFLQKIPAASTTGLDLNHYRLVTGFLDSSHTCAPAEIMQDIRITCVSPTSRSALLESLRKLVDGVGTSEAEGTLTYMAFLSLDDDVGARVYGRWKTREGLERFIRREDVNEFWAGNKHHVRAMEQRLYVPNGQGWLHRGTGYAGEKKAGKYKI
ncbi:Nn.00g035710.m01.CDS01 [Neocucurbitaria sp. VM-36]